MDDDKPVSLWFDAREQATDIASMLEAIAKTPNIATAVAEKGDLDNDGPGIAELAGMYASHIRNVLAEAE